MTHSPEQYRKKAEARADAMYHHRNSAVDGSRETKPENENMDQKRMMEEAK